MGIVPEEREVETNKLENENFIVENEIEISIEPLMPELEALVKNNPNKLIGCGG